jgi:predicted nucleotidyltransferase
MVIKDTNMMSLCKGIVREIIPNARIILYGSRARGDANKDSDYDLVVLIDGDVDHQTERLISDRLYDLELQTNKILSVLVFSLDTWNSPVYQYVPFKQNIEKEGIEL